VRSLRLSVAALAAAGALSSLPARAETTGPADGEVVETTRTINVYQRPKRATELLRGRVQKESRFAVLERARGPGCSGRWLRIDDDAWICNRYTEATDEPAGARELPALSGDEIVPHRYLLTEDARVYESLDDAAADSNADTIPGLGGFRIQAVQSRGGRRYYKTSEGWVPRSDAEIAQPSTFAGVELDADARERRQGFVRATEGATVVDARGRPVPGADPVPRQTFLDGLGEPVRAGKAKLYPIGDDRYLFARDVGLLDYAARPDEVTADDERWLDVDLSEQVLIAHVGDRPVMATLVSTARTATPEGVYHIYKKRAVSYMKSKAGHRNKYNLDTPWVMTLKGRIAMHAVYWHDDFGTARSHGCVNLAPRDAKWIWDWTEPAVPPGWLRVDTAEPDDGTVVRIRR